MAFIFFEWLISESLNLTRSKIASITELKNLNTSLDKEIDKWASSLPRHCELESVAMYLNTNRATSVNTKTYIKLIGQKIDGGELPNRQLLVDALYERWCYCRGQKYPQMFFCISEDEAMNHLTELATRLHTILLKDENLFKRFVHVHLTNLLTDTTEIKERLAQLEELIRNGEVQKGRENKVYRSIPKCDIIVHQDQEIQKYLTLSFFKIALFENFGKLKYKKFTSVFIYDNSLFENNDREHHGGLSIISGEVTFLGTCQKLVDHFCKKPKEFIETIELYEAKKEYKDFNLKVEFFTTSGAIPYSVEIDGQNKTFRIKPIIFEKIDYDNLESLNAVLPFIASLTQPLLHVIDYDKLSKCPAILKVLHQSLIDNVISFSLIEVNVDDFDEWDYKYKIQQDCV